jgi:hypothetical protein
MSEKQEKGKKKDAKSVGRQDGVIKKSGETPMDKPDPLDLLENFLKEITGAVSFPPKVYIEDLNDIQSIDWSEYPDLELSPDLDKKISELRLIANSIEKKKVSDSELSIQIPGKLLLIRHSYLQY